MDMLPRDLAQLEPRKTKHIHRPNRKKHSWAVWKFTLIIMAGLLVVCLIVGGIIFLVRRKKHKKEENNAGEDREQLQPAVNGPGETEMGGYNGGVYQDARRYG